ncbi:hypothetical protein B879_04169 [Cecembia lonarensis LW9]|uniref:Uncharacterized protein n=1 Tax=Cecembia lonarensis (strain CCUG 58316 / KCTC 22772 / LW9) TaxID=1225176 RepID=K1KSV2_CECL9|nr:hypothetical protein B879_04169 [Cecembia lonarensis LW9]
MSLLCPVGASPAVGQGSKMLWAASAVAPPQSTVQSASTPVGNRPVQLESGAAGLRHGLVLVSGPAADPDGTDDHTVTFHWDASGENHDAPVV